MIEYSELEWANISVEVMSGMGRCGTLHAWQYEGVVPDIETVAKGLSSGYSPVAAILINHRVADTLKCGSGYVSHTQHPGQELTR